MAKPHPQLPVSYTQINRLYDAAVEEYIIGVKARIPAFIAAQYSFTATWRRVGPTLFSDTLRQGGNILLAPPLWLARHLAPPAWHQKYRPFLYPAQAVAERELLWVLARDLFCLPLFQPAYAGQPARYSQQDALAQLLLGRPELQEFWSYFTQSLANIPQAKLTELLKQYEQERAGDSELLAMAGSLLCGALSVHQLTPGGLGLAQALAASLAHQSAIAAFPLGTTIGSMWYGLFPAATPLWLGVGVGAASFAGALFLAGSAPLLLDPLGRYGGWHKRRLLRLVNSLKANLPTDKAFHSRAGADQYRDRQGASRHYSPRSWYVARLFDVVDLGLTLGRHYRSL
jgi:hypothetical protein